MLIGVLISFFSDFSKLTLSKVVKLILIVLGSTEVSW